MSNTPDLTLHDAHGANGTRTRPLASLITRDLVDRAVKACGRAPLKKYVQVLDSLYTVKLGPGVTRYEYRVLQFLDTIPDIPTPPPLTCFSIDVIVDDHIEAWNLIIMSTMPGMTLSHASDIKVQAIKPDQVPDILRQVKDWMDRINEVICAGSNFLGPTGQWSRLQPPVDSISDLDGTRCIQLPLYTDWMEGPVRFDDFISTMTRMALQTEETAQMLSSALDILRPTGPSCIRFCHMDLHQGNIMVHNGVLAGIIDWELAGWYTWELEVLGAMKDVLSPIEAMEAGPYIEAWAVPTNLATAIRHSGSKLRWGHQEREQADRTAEREANEGPSTREERGEQHRQRCRRKKAAREQLLASGSVDLLPTSAGEEPRS